MPPSKLGNLFLIMLTGAVTMLFGEVISGSNVLWIIQIPSIIITYPFYIIHAIFFLNLATRLKTTNLKGLYLVGTIYGAYEFWFTTVPLYGYINKRPVLGAIMGISIFEYYTLIYFWHPIYSFIMSFAVMTYLLEKTKIQKTLPGIQKILEPSKQNYLIWSIFIFIGTMVISLYVDFNPIVFYLGYGGTLMLIFILYKISLALNPEASLQNLILDDSKFYSLGGIIIILYAAGFYYHSHYQIIFWQAFIVITITYLISIVLLKKESKENKYTEKFLLENFEKEKTLNPFSFLIAPLIAFPIIAGFSQLFKIIAIISFYSLMVIAIILIITVITTSLKQNK